MGGLLVWERTSCVALVWWVVYLRGWHGWRTNVGDMLLLLLLYCYH